MTPHELLRIFHEELRRRPYLIGFLIVLAGLALWAIMPNPKRAVKHVIERGEKACEHRDVNALDAIVATRFESPFGADRASALEFVRAEFEDLLSIEIKTKKTEIRVDGSKATATITFSISGTFRSREYGQIPFRGLQGDANALERCSMDFVKESDGSWRVSGLQLLGAVQM